MSAVGLLDDAADDARVSAREAARYDRQLRYFSDVSSGAFPPSEYQRRLREARVVILGRRRARQLGVVRARLLRRR